MYNPTKNTKYRCKLNMKLYLIIVLYNEYDGILCMKIIYI